MEVVELKSNEMLLKKENSASVYILIEGKLKKSRYAPWNNYKVHLDNLY